jgi:hypothetical protein
MLSPIRSLNSDDTKADVDQPVSPMQALLEAKAHAYDCLAQIEQWNKKLQELNQRIAELSKLTS